MRAKGREAAKSTESKAQGRPQKIVDVGNMTMATSIMARDRLKFERPGARQDGTCRNMTMAGTSSNTYDNSVFAEVSPQG